MPPPKRVRRKPRNEQLPAHLPRYEVPAAVPDESLSVDLRRGFADRSLRLAQIPDEAIRQVLLDAVSQAVAGVEAMRIREGAALLTDLQVRRQTIASLVEQVAVKSPQAVADAAVRLRERIAQLTGETGCDEARLAQEIALMADRSDITEEVVRFRSHLLQFDTILQIAEPVGRKLDFLMQEFNREANTIGSKANDAEIARLVVELKAELEKIREQVQNIE